MAFQQQKLKTVSVIFSHNDVV